MSVSYILYMKDKNLNPDNDKKSDAKERLERALRRIDKPDREQLQNRYEELCQLAESNRTDDIRFITYHSPLDIYVEYNKEAEVDGIYEDVEILPDENKPYSDDDAVSESKDLLIQGLNASLRSDMTSQSIFGEAYVEGEDIRRVPVNGSHLPDMEIKLIPADVTEEFLSEVVTEYASRGLIDSD